MILFPLLATLITVFAVLANAVMHSTDDPKIVKAWKSARNVLIGAALILIVGTLLGSYLFPTFIHDPLRGY